jgi:hypothetical protein
MQTKRTVGFLDIAGMVFWAAWPADAKERSFGLDGDLDVGD